MTYYSVALGREVGVFKDRERAMASVLDFPGALYKKFSNKQDAERYLYITRNNTRKRRCLTISNKVAAIIKTHKKGYQIKILHPNGKREEIKENMDLEPHISPVVYILYALKNLMKTIHQNLLVVITDERFHEIYNEREAWINNSSDFGFIPLTRNVFTEIESRNVTIKKTAPEYIN